MNLKNAKVIDVRTPMEFRFGHVEGALNIPMEQLTKHLEQLQSYKDTLVICCASGGRSAMVTQYLANQGFENIYDAGPWQNAELILNNFR